MAAISTWLKAGGYHFVTPGNSAIRTVRNRRPHSLARDLRDVFGWSLPFEPDLLDGELLDLMWKAEAIAETEHGLRSRIRASSVEAALFIHSAYPTRERDAVFFGPDTYRYVRFVLRHLPRRSGQRLVDIGAGSGAGGIVAGLALPASRVVLTDISAAALDFAHANALANGIACELLEGSGLNSVSEAPDVVIANPPFIADRGQTYQDGGGGRGEAIAVAWAQQSMRRLKPGGCLLLYTGAPIVNGRDILHDALSQAADGQACTMAYEEIDPDIFSGELRRPAYADVERIAAVGAIIRKAD